MKLAAGRDGGQGGFDRTRLRKTLEIRHRSGAGIDDGHLEVGAPPAARQAYVVESVNCCLRTRRSTLPISLYGSCSR